MNGAALLRRIFIWLAAILIGAAAGASCALAEENSIFYTSGSVSKEAPGDSPGVYVNASFTIHLPTAVEESLRRGVSLYFTTEFSLLQKRWYWTDKNIASRSIRRKLSYSLLTRKYFLGGEGLSQSFASLEEALSVLGSVRHWRVASPRAVSGPFQDYSARIRIQLDKSRLPRPLQISSTDWDMTSGWVSLPISPTVTAP